MKTGCTITLLIYLTALIVSWIVTCGLFWVVCLCFAWEFTWGIATGVWICWLVLKSVFNITVKK